MGRIANSTDRVQMAAHPRASHVARHLTEPSPVKSGRKRGRRTAEAERPNALNQSIGNAGSAAKVADDFPEAIPVTAHELEVIETYLSVALDEILGRAQ